MTPRRRCCGCAGRCPPRSPAACCSPPRSPPVGRLAARRRQPGAARRHPVRPLAARRVRRRPCLRPRVLLPAARLGHQPGLVRLGRARHRLGAHLRGVRHRPAAAAQPALVAARGGRLVGGRRGVQGPLALGRLPVGQAGDEPGRTADAGLGGDRRPAGALLRGRAYRRHARLGPADPRCAATARRGGGARGSRRWRSRPRRASRACPPRCPSTRCPRTPGPRKSPPSRATCRASGSLAAQLNNDWWSPLNHATATEKLAAKVAAGTLPRRTS